MFGPISTTAAYRKVFSLINAMHISIYYNLSYILQCLNQRGVHGGVLLIKKKYFSEPFLHFVNSKLKGAISEYHIFYDSINYKLQTVKYIFYANDNC